jgi:aquaporin Z
MNQAMQRSLVAEFVGTFVLVLGGCGTAVLAAGVDPGGVGLLGVSLAFGLTVVVMAYAVGHISGGHFNPAVTLGAIAGGRFHARDGAPYIVTQVIGAIAAAAVLYAIANGADGFSASDSGFASNGYDEHPPGGYSLVASLVTEFVLTAVFLVVINGGHAQERRSGLCAFGNWSVPDLDPSHQHPDNEHLG